MKGTAPAPAARTPQEHVRIAGDRVEALIDRVAADPWTPRDVPEVRQLASLPEDELRSVIVVLFKVAAEQPTSSVG